MELGELCSMTMYCQKQTVGKKYNEIFFFFFLKAFLFLTSTLILVLLLSGQDLDVISTPFQIYFIQATTTRLIEPVKLQ